MRQELTSSLFRSRSHPLGALTPASIGTCLVAAALAKLRNSKCDMVVDAGNVQGPRLCFSHFARFTIEARINHRSNSIDQRLNEISIRTSVGFIPSDAHVHSIHTRKAAELDRAQAHGLKYGEAVAQAMY
jgi:hypothetical protein